jgi:hypothetical protein
MPLARIFTRNPERTGDLATQLRQQGYKVEVTSPDQKHLAPADLEIEFELCERADVLDRAADLANELEADIAVAPGILQSTPEPQIDLKAELKVEPQPEPVTQSAVQPVVEKLEPVPLPVTNSEREREFEAAFSALPEAPVAMQEEPAVIEVPVMEQAAMPPVAILQEPAAFESVKMEKPVTAEKSIVDIPLNVSEPSRLADPEPYLAQLTPFSTPSRTEPKPATSVVRREEKASAASERGNQILQDGAKIAAQSWASAQSLATSTADSVRGYFREYKKKAQVKSAEARAAQAARMLDLEQRRAEAQQRAIELEAARAEAAARLAALVRQREPGLPKQADQTQTEQSYYWQPNENVQESKQPERIYAQSQVKPEQPRPEQPGRPDPSATAFAKPPSSASIPKPPKTKRNFAALKGTPLELWRTVNPPLRAVLTGAAAVSALFIMGIALGLFHSRAPLANTNDAATGVTVQGNGATVQTGSEQATSAKPQPGTPTKAQSGVTEAQASAKPSPRISHAQQLVAEQSETKFGDDVVVRHFSRPVPTQKPKQSGQQAGLKHFSDLTN